MKCRKCVAPKISEYQSHLKKRDPRRGTKDTKEKFLCALGLGRRVLCGSSILHAIQVRSVYFNLATLHFGRKGHFGHGLTRIKY